MPTLTDAPHEFGLSEHGIRNLRAAYWNLGAAELIEVERDPLANHVPAFTLIFVPGLQANPAEDGTNSETCIAADFTRKVVIIAGTSYAGELKKSVFTILNYLLPERNTMPMHCSA